MKKYILKRVLISVFTLLAITLMLFILLQLMPGSPFNDEKLSDDQRAVLYEKYGLDQPIIIQFGKYVANLFRGDFGVSYTISKNTPISQLIKTRLPISIRVGGQAVALGALAAEGAFMARARAPGQPVCACFSALARRTAASS